MSEEPTRPSWVTTIDGTPEAFKPLSKEDAEELALAAITEARRFSEGQGMRFLSDDQKLLLDAQRRREHHKRSAELFAETGNEEEERKHRQWWSDAALDCGLTGEAKEALTGTGDTERLAFISELRRGILAPDDRECDCEREIVEDEKGKTFALDRRYAIRRIFSPVHNQIVTIWKCRQCGDLNATPLTPERQTEYEVNRKRLEAAARMATDKAPPKGATDAQVLKTDADRPTHGNL